jgi:hypothetical protein
VDDGRVGADGGFIEYAGIMAERKLRGVDVASDNLSLRSYAYFVARGLC